VVNRERLNRGRQTPGVVFGRQSARLQEGDLPKSTPGVVWPDRGRGLDSGGGVAADAVSDMRAIFAGLKTVPGRVAGVRLAPTPRTLGFCNTGRGFPRTSRGDRKVEGEIRSRCFGRP